MDPEQDLTSTPGDSGQAVRRVQIDVEQPLHEKVDEACAALVGANDDKAPRVLVRGNTLVRVAERGALEDLSPDALRDELSRVTEFWKTLRNGPQPKDPPMDVARTLLGRDSGEYGGLPRVDRIVDVPVLSASGKLVTEPGYHAEDRLYYMPAPGLEGTEPSDITSIEDVASARDLILNLFGDFDFKDEASRANAIGLSFLPFVRDFIGAYPTPLYAFKAPQPGVGKTYLAEAALIPGCGKVPVQADAEGEEWRKRVTSLLLQGKPAVLLDNFTTVRSAALAATLTTTEWEDRILGESRMVSLQNRAAWAVTGNNLSVSPENFQRTVWVELDPGEKAVARERDKREFRHPDLHGWARRNRAELVRAYLTIIAVWDQGIVPVRHGDGEGVHLRQRTDHEGDPVRMKGERTMGSFERHAEVVGGILEAAGIEGFLGNRDRLAAELDDDTADAAAFLAAWHELHPEPVQLSELVALCTTGPLRTDLPAKLMGKRDLAQPLSYWLRGHNGSRQGDYQLVKDQPAGHGQRTRWTVRKTGR